MVAFERIDEPSPSPDGKWVAFTRRVYDPIANKNTTNLWLVSTDGTISKQLTTSTHKSNTSPVWSPDSSTIAFISNRGESAQIWTIEANGKSERQLTKLPLDVGNLRWSPDGTRLAFSADVYPDANMDETAKREKAKGDDPVKAMLFDRLMVRHWDTWNDGKCSHIFVLPVKKTPSGWGSSGSAVDLMKGVDGDSPTKPFGGIDDYAWSPDGKEIAYTAQLGRDMAWSTDLDIFVVSASGGEARSITIENNATDRAPVYSPDGRTIAFLAMSKPGFEADRLRIKLYDRASGKTRTLTEAWDFSPNTIVWDPSGETIYTTAEQAARQKIFAIDVATGTPRVLVSDHYNGSLSLVRGAENRLMFAQDSMLSPVEIWTSKIDGTEPRQLTHVNTDRLKALQMSTPEEFYFSGANNEQVHAWALKPVDYVEGKKYPVAFLVHGGPQGTFADHFSYRWNYQAFAGAGYAVVIVNFHGSTGFGQKFTDSISGDWGGKPYEDLMKGLDFALNKFSWLDKDRVGALGGSFGGWMINWINGHTDRFKCLVNHDGIFDNFGMYFSTDELWFMEWEHRGTPWDKPEAFDRVSPARFVRNWKTPTLVIHGGKDFRIVETEGIATFTALQRRGILSKLLYFPEENHWVLKAKNSILWHETVLAWLDQWLKKDSGAQAQANNTFE